MFDLFRFQLMPLGTPQNALPIHTSYDGILLYSKSSDIQECHLELTTLPVISILTYDTPMNGECLTIGSHIFIPCEVFQEEDDRHRNVYLNLFKYVTVSIKPRQGEKRNMETGGRERTRQLHQDGYSHLLHM